MNTINWKLVFLLSLFGLAMALGTVYLVPPGIEPFLWLIIFLLCAWLIARYAGGRYFLHGFLTSLANAVWITCAHVLLYSAYIAGHPSEAEMAAKMPMPDHPRLQMLVTGPVIGLLSGLVLGLFALIASKIVKKPQAA